MRSAPADKTRRDGEVVLERTTAQTLWWALGHPVSVAVISSLLVAAVITASALATGRATVGETSTTSPSSDSAAVPNRPTEAIITVTCPSDARLSITAAGTGLVELTIGGPATAHAFGMRTVAATVSGPAGTYTAHASATVRLDTVYWSSTNGACTG